MNIQYAKQCKILNNIQFCTFITPDSVECTTKVFCTKNKVSKMIISAKEIFALIQFSVVIPTGYSFRTAAFLYTV